MVGIVQLSIFISAVLFSQCLFGQENDYKTVEFSVGVKTYYCYLSGDIFVTAGGEPGTATRIDFNDDLDLGNAFSFKPFIEIEIADKHLFNFSFVPLRFKGENVLPDTEIFRATTFPGNSLVKSQLDIDLYELKYSYKIIKNSRIGWSLNIAGHLYNMGTKLTVTSADGSKISADRTLTPFFPTIGTGIEYSLSSKWSLDLAVEGIILSNDQSYFGVEGELEYSVNDNISLNTGVLFTNVHFARSTNNGKIVTTMPFIGERNRILIL